MTVMFFGVLTVLMLAVMVFDVTKFIIPNWLNLAVLLLYPLMVYHSPLPIAWVQSFYAFTLFFTIGLGVYLLGIMGGGDIKLLIVSSFWFGWTIQLTYFIVYVAMIGGAISIVLIMGRPLAAAIWEERLKAGKTLPRVLTKGQPVPYGVAIAGSFLFLLWTGHVAGLAVPKF